MDTSSSLSRPTAVKLERCYSTNARVYDAVFMNGAFASSIDYLPLVNDCVLGNSSRQLRSTREKTLKASRQAGKHQSTLLARVLPPRIFRCKQDRLFAQTPDGTR